MAKWIDLGVVTVDSGQIQITDPCLADTPEHGVTVSPGGDGFYRVQGRMGDLGFGPTLVEVRILLDPMHAKPA